MQGIGGNGQTYWLQNIVYNVWSSLNLSNVTIDYLNATIWNEIDIINSNLNYTNLTIKNVIFLSSSFC